MLRFQLVIRWLARHKFSWITSFHQFCKFTGHTPALFWWTQNLTKNWYSTKAPQSTVGLLRRDNITRVKSDTHSHLTEIRCETSWCFLILSHPSSASCPRSSDALQNSSDMKATQQIKCSHSKANKSFKICSLPKFQQLGCYEKWIYCHTISCHRLQF